MRELLRRETERDGTADDSIPLDQLLSEEGLDLD
jgi:hypothetical protein